MCPLRPASDVPKSAARQSGAAAVRAVRPVRAVGVGPSAIPILTFRIRARPRRTLPVGRVPRWTTRWFDGLDGLGLAAAIRDGEVTAVEAVDAAIRRIETYNPRLNVVVATRFDAARAEAAGPSNDGPFAGVPYLVKSLGGDVAGLPTSRGSRLWADDVAVADSLAVARARAAGRDRARDDEHARARQERVYRTGVPRTDPQPARPRSVRRRIERRLGGRGRVGHGADRARERRWGFDPHPDGPRAGCSA